MVLTSSNLSGKTCLTMTKGSNTLEQGKGKRGDALSSLKSAKSICGIPALDETRDVVEDWEERVGLECREGYMIIAGTSQWLAGGNGQDVGGGRLPSMFCLMDLCGRIEPPFT